jgi:hypothetical protein
MSFSEEHKEQLQQAKFLLENPSVTARFSNALAGPIEKGMAKLPDGARGAIMTAATESLEVALKAALFTLSDEVREASNLTHKVSAAVTGGLGGAFGLAGLSVELPISTTIILRSIADIARSEGEDLKLAEGKLSCLEVFALGGGSASDDAAESGYFAIRSALAATVSQAATSAASQSVGKEAAPQMVKLITQIAARFSIPVTQKAAAQAVPIIGAAGGAFINTLFIDHFQDVAKGHFVVRRLERYYGSELTRSVYESLPTAKADG